MHAEAPSYIKCKGITAYARARPQRLSVRGRNVRAPANIQKNTPHRHFVTDAGYQGAKGQLATRSNRSLTEGWWLATRQHEAPITLRHNVPQPQRTHTSTEDTSTEDTSIAASLRALACSVRCCRQPNPFLASCLLQGKRECSEQCFKSRAATSAGRPPSLEASGVRQAHQQRLGFLLLAAVAITRRAAGTALRGTSATAVARWLWRRFLLHLWRCFRGVSDRSGSGVRRWGLAALALTRGAGGATTW